MTTPPHGAAWFLVESLSAGSCVLDGDEGRHALVRRPRPGDQLVLTDAAGSWAVGTVEAVQRSGVRLTVGPATLVPAPELRVVLVQAVPKGDHGVLAVDLATEAGIDEIVPWTAARSVARWEGKTDRAAEKWRTTARSAAKQARRPRVPPVAELHDTAAVLRRVSGADRALVLHEDATLPLARAELPERGELLLIVGPEGGLDEAELAALTAAGAVAVRLGPEVLRSSAAAAVALGALGVLTGRWSS